MARSAAAHCDVRRTAARPVAIAVVVLAAGLSLLAPAVASAHAYLVTTSPPIGAVTRSSPSVVSLTYDESVTISPGALEVVDPAGRRVAIERGEDELIVDGRPMNPRLHLMIHEVVATQIIDGDPPEMVATAERLAAAGRDRHDVLHMLGSTVSEQIWSATHDRRPYDRAAHLAALAALPGSWDEMARPARQFQQRRGGRRPRRR